MHLALISDEKALTWALRDALRPGYRVAHFLPRMVMRKRRADMDRGVQQLLTSTAVLVVCEGDYARVLTHLHELLRPVEAPLVALCPSPAEQAAPALLAGAEAAVRLPLSPMLLMAHIETCRRKRRQVEQRARHMEAWLGRAGTRGLADTPR